MTPKLNVPATQQTLSRAAHQVAGQGSAQAPRRQPPDQGSDQVSDKGSGRASSADALITSSKSSLKLSSRSSQKSLTNKLLTGKLVTAERARVGLGASLGILLLLGLWTWLASGEPELIFPSPPETWAALSSLARSGKLVSASLITLGRAAGAVLLALAVGLIWGTLNGLSKWAKAVSAPLLGALMALPPIVLVILGITWLGPSGQTAQLVVFWVAIPLIVVATAEAVSAVDRDLLEMAAAFKLGRATTLRHVIIPAVASPLLAAVSVALGQSLRVAVMGELLSATSGVGAEVARARANVATADVFAWALVLVAVVLTVELVLLRPLAGRVLGWRNRACERR